MSELIHLDRIARWRGDLAPDRNGVFANDFAVIKEGEIPVLQADLNRGFRLCRAIGSVPTDRNRQGQQTGRTEINFPSRQPQAF